MLQIDLDTLIQRGRRIREGLTFRKAPSNVLSFYFPLIYVISFYPMDLFVVKSIDSLWGDMFSITDSGQFYTSSNSINRSNRTAFPV